MNYSFDNIVEGSGKELKIGDLPVERGKDISNVQLLKCSKRKFPGPAGILPNSPLPDIEHADVPQDDGSKKKLMIKDELYSSHTAIVDDVFTSNIWMSLLADLGPDANSILGKFSIRSSLLKASKKLLHKGKISLIAGYVENVNEQGSDISFVIRDQSGKMKGSLHQEIMKESKTAIHSGSVVILRQVSVISPSSRTHYLNVTPGNIVVVYTSDTKKGVVKHSFLNKQNCTTTDGNPSLNDVIKESELESIKSLQIFKEKLTKKSLCSLRSLNVSKSFLSSPAGLSNQQVTSVSLKSTESRKKGFNNSMPHTYVNEIKNSTRNISSFQGPLMSNDKSACSLFSSPLIEDQRLISNIGIMKPSISFSCSDTPLTSTDILTTRKKGNFSEHLLTQSPQTEKSDIEDSIYLLQDDDDMLQMCDIVDRIEHNSTSKSFTAELLNDNKVISPVQWFDKTSVNYNENHPSLLGKQILDKSTNCSSQLAVINGSNIAMDQNKSSHDVSVADLEKDRISADFGQMSSDLGQMSTDIERDSRIQLVHAAPSLITSNELFPHWEDDFNTDMLLSQLSEEF